MTSTKDILREVSISYMGIELNRILPLKKYGEYLCDIFDSEDRHTATLALDTGSIYYNIFFDHRSFGSCIITAGRTVRINTTWSYS